MTARQRSLSIVVPAFNEAGNIVATLENITRALAQVDLDAEVVVVDDGSRDGTGALVTAEMHRFRAVRLLVNERNIGFGATYRRGVDAATREHIVMVHGDNAWGAETLQALFARTGDADIIVGYTRDMWRVRPLVRTIVSKAFTAMVNGITGHHLKYYNGLQIHRTDVLKALTIQSSGYGFQAEVLVKALRNGGSLLEVPMDLREREQGDSKAFRLKNAVDVLQTLKRLHAAGKRESIA
jgi:glycosyltransferase involved in cell wall biosynthesis